MPPLPPEPDPMLGFRFAVTFMDPEAREPTREFRFQRVSGLSIEVKTTTVSEGGQNAYDSRRPDHIEHGNLVLERGLSVGSKLDSVLESMLGDLDFQPLDVMVTLLDGGGAQARAWMFMRAYPVRWTTSDLDASKHDVVIDTIELAYARMRVLRV